MTPLEAAKLLIADYAGALLPAESIELAGVSASIVIAHGETALLIRGTDQLSDWLRYNFRFLPEVGPGDRYQWHRGFLHHAQIAYAFAKGKGVTIVLGHSLGAAAGGIVAAGLSVPALCFATPRAWFSGEDEPDPPEAATILNLCRIDDHICQLPSRALGFRHLGQVRWLRTKGLHLGQDHTLLHYLELLDDEP
jgi:hypothetical protein